MWPSEAVSRSTGRAHAAASRVSGSVLMRSLSLVEVQRLRCSSEGGEGRLFGLVNRDHLVEPGELEDLAVVVGQAVREDLLAVPLRAHEQRHEQPDAARV